MSMFSLSVLEISRIVEEAFLPDRCVCSSPDGVSLNVQILPFEGGRGVSVVGIPLSQLTSSRSIAKLVLELREEVRMREMQAFDKRTSEER